MAVVDVISLSRFSNQSLAVESHVKFFDFLRWFANKRNQNVQLNHLELPAMTSWLSKVNLAGCLIGLKQYERALSENLRVLALRPLDARSRKPPELVCRRHNFWRDRGRTAGLLRYR
jgi:hypothetical protein